MEVIDCKEKWPTEYINVLVWVHFPFSDKPDCCDLVYFSHNEGWDIAADKNYKVTHWMEVEPPKKKE